MVGVPVGLFVVLMLATAFPVGYVMTALVVGRLVARRTTDVAAFLIGFAILRALAIIPGLGWLIGFLAAAFGIGVLAVAARRRGRPSAREVSSSTVGPSPGLMTA